MTSDYYSDIIKIIEPADTRLDLPVINPDDGTIVTDLPAPADPYIEPKEIIIPKEPLPVLIPEDDPKRSFHYSGIVTDADNGQPLPGATVKIYRDGNQLAAIAAGNDGSFDLYTNEEADSITITNIDYKGKIFPATQIRHDFPLEKDIEGLEEVIVTAGPKKNKNWWVWLVVAAVIAKEEKLI